VTNDLQGQAKGVDMRSDTLGTTRTQTVTNWYDVLTLVSVKESITIAYAGTLPTTGYPVSGEIVLQSLM
jgi:hypothetical protein